MARKRITEMFPALLPLRIRQRKACFYLSMALDKNRYAHDISIMALDNNIYKAVSPMINKNSGYDIKYQYNKVHNLKLAAKAMNGLLIRPGETFSFCLATKNADKNEPYLDGLSLVDGQIKGEYGGGLCQLSNLLHWVFMHSLLTITERHGHGTEAIPPMDWDSPIGIDATVSEGWLDLKVKNETAHTYQLLFDFDEENIICRLMCSEAEPWKYKIFNEMVEYYESNGKTIEISTVMRAKTSIQTSESTEELLYNNTCEISYPLPETINVKKGDF